MKTPINAPKVWIIGEFDALNGGYPITTPKGTNGCRNTSYELLSVKIALKCDLYRRGEARIDFNRKKRQPKPVSSRMRGAKTAESILIKFGTSTPLPEVVIYLKRHQIDPTVWEG